MTAVFLSAAAACSPACAAALASASVHSLGLLTFIGIASAVGMAVLNETSDSFVANEPNLQSSRDKDSSESSLLSDFF